MPPVATAPQPIPVAMDKRRAAAYLGISVRTLDRLPIPRLALMRGKVMYRREAIDAFLASRETPPSQQS